MTSFIKYVYVYKTKNSLMSRLVMKMILLVATMFVFASFQYGGINTPPPFANSWQSVFVAIAMAISAILLLHEILIIINAKKLLAYINAKRF